MSPNSHVVKWLNSLYRVVLRRQWSDEARRASGACVLRAAAAAAASQQRRLVEPLEGRVLLSTTNLVDVPLATYTGNPTIQSNMQHVLAAGIGALADQISAVSQSGDFTTDVPGVLQYTTFGQAPTPANLLTMLGAVNGGGLADLIKDNVADTIDALAAGTSITGLQFNANNSGAPLTDVHYNITTSNAQLTLDSGSNYKLTVVVEVTVTDDDSDALFFDLGRNADQFGIRPTVDNVYFPSFPSEVNVKAGLTVKFTAGTDVTLNEITPGTGAATPDTQVVVADDNSGFFETGGSITANANADTNAQGVHPTSAFQQLGFLDVNLTLQQYALDGHIRLDLQDGASNGSTIRFTDLGGLTHSAPAVTGTIGADVDVAVDDVSGTGFATDFQTGPHNYQVHFTGQPLGAAVSSIPGSGDRRAAPGVTLSADALQRLEPYNHVTAGAVAGMIKTYAERLGSLPASSVLNATLPLVQGTSLGDLLPLGDLISSHLVFDPSATPASAGTKLVDNNGNAAFTSAQTFASRLATILGVSNATIQPRLVSDSGKNQLLFTIGLDLSDPPLALTAAQDDINLDLDALEPFAGLSATAKVNLTPSGHVGFDFGIDVAAPGTAPVVIAPPVQNTRLTGVVDGAGLVQTPANGVLPGDAVFKLTVGGSPNGGKSFGGGVATVRLNASTTAGNATVAQLIAQLQSAIDTALNKLDLDPNDPTHTQHLLPNPVSQPIAGHKLVTVGQLPDHRLTLSSEFTSLLKVSIVTPDDAGGFAKLGFVNNQTGSIAPTPFNGRLSGNATFKLRLATAAAVAVTVPQSQTNGNTSAADLVADINAALPASLAGRVHAELLPGSSGAIVLRVDDPAVRSLQVVDPNAVTVRDLGWQDRQVNAEIQAAGRNDLNARAGAFPTLDGDGNPGTDFSFSIDVDALAPVVVNVLQHAIPKDPAHPSNPFNLSNTADNASVADLAADINAAFGSLRLSDGRLLGSLISATAIDTNHDGAAKPDTIEFRSTADIQSFHVATGANSGSIGLTAALNGVRVGPDPLTGGLPADATFTITVGSLAPQVITVLATDTSDNAASGDPIGALAKDIESKITAALATHVVVGRSGNHLVITAPDISDQLIRITLDESSAAGAAARDRLGFQDGQVARSAGNVAYFVDDASAQLGVSVGVTDAKATGHVGFVSVDVNDVDASLGLDLDLQLLNNQTNSSRININELDSRLTDITVKGTATLPDGSAFAAQSFKIKVNGGSEITVNVPGGATTRNAEVQAIQKALDDALKAAHVNARVRASLGTGGTLVLSVSALQAGQFEVTAGNAVFGLTPTGPRYSLLKFDGATASWTGTLDVQGIAVHTPIPGLNPTIPDQHLNVGNALPGLASFTPTIPVLDSLPQSLKDFLNLVFDSPLAAEGQRIIGALQDLADFFNGNFDDLPFLGTKIPVINKSLADLLNVSNSFQKVVDAFKANPTDTVQGLRNRLIEALNLPSDPTDDPGDPVHVTYDSATHSLLLDLTFVKAFNNTLPIDFDLGLPFELKGNAALEVEGGATAKLGIGIDLTNPLSPVFFLNTDSSHTTFGLTFAARGSGMSFNLSFGPAGLFVNDGQLAIDGDGNPLTKTDPLGFNVTLSDDDGTANNRVSFADILSNIDNVGIHAGSVTGTLSATLPVFFPTDSDFLGNLGITINDLGGFLTNPTDTSLVDVQGEEVVQNLIDNLSNFSLLDNLPLLIDGVDFTLGQIQTLLDQNLGSTNLPLIGGGIHDAAQFINNIRSTVFETLRQRFAGAVQHTDQVITDALNEIFATKLGILDPAGVHVNKQINGDSNDFVEWTFGIGQSFSVGTPFDLGLPIFGLKSDSPITLGVNWHANLGFGIDFDHGFYFKVNDAPNTPELTAGLTVNLPNTIEGNLLFFKLTAQDRTPGTTPAAADLTASFNLDLADGGADDGGKVGLTDLGDLDIAPSLTGDAKINLHLKAGINGGGVVSNKVIAALPSLVADFKLMAGVALPVHDGNSAFSLTEVSFNNIGLDLGSFFSDFLSPLVQGIQEVTKPLQPFIDVFTAPIPVISDLAGQPVTLLDVAALFGDVDPGMLDAIAKIVTLVNSIPDPGQVGDIIIPFGSITLVGGANPASDFNLFDTHALDSVRDSNTPLSGRFADAANAFGGFGSAVDNAINSSGAPAPMDPQVSSFAKGLENKSFADFIDFPILHDPSQVIGALFGRPFNLVTVDLPKFSFGFSYSQFFPIVGPLGASITGSLEASFDFAFGYDSLGLQKFAEGGFAHPLDLFRGFYVSDTANADGTGADVNEVEIAGSLVGAAELNLGVAKGSVGGGVKVTFGLNLNDPNHDGKVRIEELVNNIRFAEPAFNPLGIFDLGIKVEAFLTWAVEVLFVFKASGQIGPSLPLLDLTIPLPHSSVLATDVGGGVLRLNTGPFAGDRLNNDTSDGDETITVTEVSPGHYRISGFGETDQDYDGNFTRIEAFGGQGNDHFIFKGVTIPVMADGGQGDDTIDFSQSSGPLTAVGGTGNDKIFGGSGKDNIDGGDGADLLLGGANDDVVHGGQGDDTIGGDAGNDKLFGDAGNDKIGGGAGADYVGGGAGGDDAWGDSTFDTGGALLAAATDGDDTISGGDDKDTLHGEGGNDRIGGGAAADLIEGGLGADTIYGDSTYDEGGQLHSPLPQTSGGDRIYGESATAALTGNGSDGGDTIHGEEGNDFVRGNSGNDTIYGDDGADLLFGDQNDDHIEGGDGGDIAFGGAQNDTVLGQAGSDLLFGDDGLVVYFAFPGFPGYAGDMIVGGNRLIGDGSSGIVPPAAGFDADPLSRDLAITDVRGTDGDDYVDGAAGNDAAFGGDGNDHVFGDGDPSAPGFDPATSPAGDDLLFGDGGQVRYNNRVVTRAATVTPDKGGQDTVFGNNGNDVAFGGRDADHIDGGHGTNLSTTGSDKDVLVGDQGQVDYAQGKVTVIQTTDTADNEGGADTVNGNEDADVILGGVLGDFLNGNLGTDVLIGDEGKLEYNLSAGAGFDGDAATLDRIQTTSFALGGNDTITGADANDVALGGAKDDNIKGDAPLDDPGDDVLIGDQAEVDFFAGNVTRVITTDVTDADGGVDTISGNEGNDVILGGVRGDLLNGNDGNDTILGDEGQLQYNLTGAGRDGNPLTVDNIETLQPALGGSDTIQGNAGRDTAFGGAAGDFVYGDADTGLNALQDGDDTLFGDGGRASLLNGVVWKLESTDTNVGGSDYMEGNAGNDIMLGGAQGDEMHGDAGNDADVNAARDGNDTMLGDNGLLNWLYTGDPAFAAIESGFNFAVVGADITTLDLITTTAKNDGGADQMFGNAGGDVMFGGTDADLLVGDNTKAASGAAQFGTPSARPGSDLEFGDHGRLYPQHSFLGASFPSRNFFSIDTGFADGGKGDLMFGNETDDVMLGGQGDDRMFGNAGDDDMVGGHNVAGGIDEFERPTGTTANDYMDGGTGDDAIAGDNATVWRNGAALQPNDLRLRVRTLNGALLYKADGTPNITAGGHNDPLSATTRSVFLLDHSAAIESADGASLVGSRWGNDVIAGNAGDDAIFGQLGNDLIQGDGGIDENDLDVQIFEGVQPNGTITDGDDYVEGNGGADLLIGNLGQDDIIGGSSQFFGLTSGTLRPDGGDIIFGGAANPARVKRHAFSGDVAGDQLFLGGASLSGRHAADADFILGDNGDVYRIVTDAGPGGQGGATTFVAFNYDQSSAFEDRGSRRIVVRAYDKLDYSPIEANTTSIGARDVIHGESGDDFIHGMTGDDILYGDGEDDEMFGERGRDWMSGGTGDDAMLGDNGLVFTSRNSVAEPLYGVVATTQQYISEPGDFLQYLLNPNGRLKHAVDLEPFDQGGDDVMYGGLGDDVMHGGEGNDGMLGGEALPAFYNSPATSPHVEVGDLPEDRAAEIRIVPRDGNGNVITGFYDFVNSLPKLANFFLNFENDLALQGEIGAHFDITHGDGKDFIFGDWGSDWLVGGTGRDHVYGGMGNDILNLDDDLETDGGKNDQPDFGQLIPGDPGAPAQVYNNSDFAYGGGGRDLLIGNTGADRLEDWVGEYNSFVVPFAPFGNGQVERQVPPSTYDFYYMMSESDGADQTRVGALAAPAGGAFGDPARHGEPYGEMGLVTQKDKLPPFDWGTQNGAPIDRQAGNTPGGKRDTRGDGLSGGTTNSTATTSATVVFDIPQSQVIKQSFAYWASSISGLSNVTLNALASNEPFLQGASLNGSLKLVSVLFGVDEYRWVVVPI